MCSHIVEYSFRHITHGHIDHGHTSTDAHAHTQTTLAAQTQTHRLMYRHVGGDPSAVAEVSG